MCVSGGGGGGESQSFSGEKSKALKRSMCYSQKEQDRNLKEYSLDSQVREARSYSWHLSQAGPRSVWARMAGDWDLTAKGGSGTGQSSSVVASPRKTAFSRLRPGRLPVSTGS